jgi:hypothetical protein
MHALRHAVTAKVALVLFGVFGGLTLCELALMGLGSPRDLLAPVANPPNTRTPMRTDEYTYLIETNATGLRYPDIPLAKPRGTVRVFVVGDSYVLGDGVAMAERFTERLEQRFTRPERPVQFVNGGLGGAGAFDYARLFHGLGLRYGPDALLICVNANDLADVQPGQSPAAVGDTVVRATHPAGALMHRVWPRLESRVRLALSQRRRKTAQPDGADFDLEQMSEVARQHGIPQDRIDAWRARVPPAWVEAVHRGGMWAYLLTWGLFRPDYLTLAVDVAGEGADARWQIESSLLSAMVATARAHGVQAAAVFLPNAYLFDPGAVAAGEPFPRLGGKVRPEWATGETEIQRRLQAWAESERVPLLDLTPAFRAGRAAIGPLHYPLDGHWTPRGHEIAATALARWIEGEGALPVLGGSPQP